MMSNLWCLCICPMLLAGCGGSEQSDSNVVPPPTPTVIEQGEPTALDADPPGGIEMPQGNVPISGSEDSRPSDGGLQMPKGVTIPDSPSPDASAPGDLGASADVKVNYATWDAILSVAKSSGQVTVVDLWSLSCEPCLKEFPGLVRLHQTMGSSVQCIAVDVDFDGRKSRPPEYYEDQVKAFLDGVGASGFPTYICETPSDDVFAAADVVSIPAVLIFSADGQLVKAFVDAGQSAGFSYEHDIIPLVTKLVG